MSTVGRWAFDGWGRVRLTPDADNTNRIVDDLIRVNEAELPTQWRLEDYSPARRAAHVPHIIGFEFEVTKLEPKFKLTQHYGDADKRGAAAGLKSRGTDAAREIAELMLSTCSIDGDKPGADIGAHLGKT